MSGAIPLLLPVYSCGVQWKLDQIVKPSIKSTIWQISLPCLYSLIIAKKPPESFKKEGRYAGRVGPDPHTVGSPTQSEIYQKLY
jgi:hypothetical protein